MKFIETDCHEVYSAFETEVCAKPLIIRYIAGLDSKHTIISGSYSGNGEKHV
jgi:hypothetical protein